MSIKRYVLRGLAAVVAGALVLALAASAYLYVASERVLHKQYEAPFETVEIPTDSASIAEGQRLARIRGCYGGCHGEGLEGEVWMDSFSEGRAVAPNLTAVAHDYAVADLVRVIRYGVRPNGEGVQIMPSPMFYHLSDTDLGRILAFLRSVPRVEGHPYAFRPGPHTRWMMATGVWLPWPEDIAQLGPRMPPPSPPDTLRLGEYLARTVCTECHGNDLQGDPFGGTPDLVIAAAYSFDDFLRLMQTGVALGERTVGLMSEVARSRFRYLTDAEIHALHTFLQRRAAQKTTPEAG